MTLTKARMLESIQNQIGFTQKRSSEIAETLFKITKRTLESGEDVLVSNFDKFCVKPQR